MQKNGKLRREGQREKGQRSGGRVGRSQSNPSEADSRTQKEFVLAALDRFERQLTGYAVRMYGGDLHSARDAVQHSFMQLCKQDPTEIQSRLAPWLYSVCRNRILDDLKSKTRSATETFDDSETVDTNAQDPAKRLEVEDCLKTLQKLIRFLNRSEREVIELWSRGLTTNEIAEVLKKKPATVRVNLHRAIKRLKQHPNISNWLERATGQLVRPDEKPVNDTHNLAPSSKCNEVSTSTISGEQS
jgi:RNA polymerase sigma-70 factor (ECF subfamily)